MTATDENYWKERYSDQWEASVVREREVQKRIEQDTGAEVELVGFGAGSTEYIRGSASRNGSECGGADLHVVGTTIFVEVTGPMQTQGQKSDLWVRPDKARSAWRHRIERQTYVVHRDGAQGLWRVIPLGEELFAALQTREIPARSIEIRGATERYFCIPATSRFVKHWDFLIGEILDPM